MLVKIPNNKLLFQTLIFPIKKKKKSQTQPKLIWKQILSPGIKEKKDDISFMLATWNHL